jgi:chemotaxis protein methyltransferase CheR
MAIASSPATPSGLLAANAPPKLKPETFRRVQSFIYNTAGIDIQDGKEEMVTARLWKQSRRSSFPSIEAYLAAVERDGADPRGGDLLAGMIDCLTTNYTSFFREPAHFEFLRHRILPELKERARIPVWTAASSTGEEPYSIAIALWEELGALASQRASVLATDISTRVLKTASLGIYPQDRFRDLPEEWKRRYLLRGKGENAGHYKIRPEIRSMVEFRRQNLMEGLPAEGPFPVVFLRNIMIYFDRAIQERVVAAISSKIEPGGYLFIGHSESLNGISHGLEHVQVAIYRKPKPGLSPPSASRPASNSSTRRNSL